MDRQPGRPFFSCIMCIFNENSMVQRSIDSILMQSFADFELIIVDDGADDVTRSFVMSYADPRVKILRQANSGLSSARNLALQHACGRYICFLDGDDSRPAWAFAAAAAILKADSADVLFTAGRLVERRNECGPFYDAPMIAKVAAITGMKVLSKEAPDFKSCLSLLMLIEPQVANKFISLDLIKKHSMRFPDGYFFEDIFFHSLVVNSLSSFVVSTIPTFTYYIRYGRPQITATSGLTRFDSIGVASQTLEMFKYSENFTDVAIRTSVIVACFRIVFWCRDCLGAPLRSDFEKALSVMVHSIDMRYFLGLSQYIARGLPYIETANEIDSIRTTVYV